MLIVGLILTPPSGPNKFIFILFFFFGEGGGQDIIGHMAQGEACRLNSSRVNYNKRHEYLFLLLL